MDALTSVTESDPILIEQRIDVGDAADVRHAFGILVSLLEHLFQFRRRFAKRLNGLVGSDVLSWTDNLFGDLSN